jgi:hypothetical protein
LHNFVHIRIEGASLVYFSQILALYLDDVDKALVLATNECALIDHGYRENEVLSRNLVNYVEALGVDHVEQLLLCSDK